MKITHAGIEITITDSGQFQFTWGSRTYGHYRLSDAKEAIDELIKARDRQDRRRCAIPIITAQGERSTCTGLHGSTGKVLTSPALKKLNAFGDDARVFIDCPQSSQLVQIVLEAEAKAAAAKRILEKEYYIAFEKAYSDRGTWSHETSMNKLEALAKKHGIDLGKGKGAAK